MPVAAVTVAALDVKITPSKSTKVSQQEVSNFINYVKHNERVVLSEDVAKNVIEQNRLLSDAFLREKGLQPWELDNIRFGLEKTLSKRYIAEREKKIDVDDEVLESYYVSHLDKYRIGNTVDFEAYTFTKYHDALQMYKQYQSGKSDAEAFAKEHNATIQKRHDFAVSNLDPALKYLLEDNASVPYLTVPTRYRKKYIVLRINKVQKDALLAFKKVKGEIRNHLLAKTRARTRDELLESLRKTEEK